MTPAIDPRVDPQQTEREQLAQIDTSMRGPTVLFLLSGLLWLLVGTALGLITAIKLQSPEFLSGSEWLTYGRVYPACLNALVYGWGCPVAFAVGLWIMARLCRTQVKHLGILYIAGAFWNAGVLWGIAGILLGNLNAMPLLEMPSHVGPLLIFSFVMMSVWGVLAFHYRQPGPVYVSQWYILAALFWFPWVFFAAYLTIFYAPARGVVEAVADVWFVNNLSYLWFAPIALAAIYYLLPKMLDRPVQRYYLSLIGFWIYALFSGWAGPRMLVYGPVPVWIQTLGVVGGMMMMAPVIITGINFYLTLLSGSRGILQKPALLFVIYGMASFTIATVIGALASLRGVNIITNFTQFTVGQSFQAFYGFFTMTIFGAVYFMLPRILNREWPSALLVKFHFWSSAIGVTALVLALYYFGWRQGSQLVNPQVPFIDTVKDAAALNLIRTLCGALIACGQLALLLNIARLLLGALRDGPLIPQTRAFIFGYVKGAAR